MPEGECGGVKGQASERIGDSPVFPVSCYRMADGSELDANLVLPAGLKLDFQKCELVFLLQNTEMRHCLLPAVVYRRRAHFQGLRIFFQP